MGGLYGSEYHTYILPRRVGRAKAMDLTERCLPLGTQAAKAIGFLDDAFGESTEEFEKALMERATEIAHHGNFWRLLREKHERRIAAECIKPLAAYRAVELKKMWVNFFGPDPAYHQARQKFVYKGAPVPQVAAPMRRQARSRGVARWWSGAARPWVCPWPSCCLRREPR
ncbi:MAG: hypothetical protein ACREV3_02200 [Gammaproteobacteria bacterium]